MTSIYKYEAIAANGERLTGEIEADSANAVNDQLSRSGSFLVSIDKADGATRSNRLGGVGRGSMALSRSQVTMLFRELAMLVGAGLPLSDSLQAIARDTRSAAVKNTATRLDGALGEGKSFHEALALAPRSFDAFTVNMVRVGEASGTLSKVFERIADSREREAKVRSKLWSAMLYPCFLIATALIAVAVMLGFVVPRFKTLIANTKAEIPPETALIINLSDWLHSNFDVLALIIPLFGGLIALAPHSTAIRRAFNRVIGGLPGIGPLVRLNQTIRFCRGLGTLLECGVELPRALTLTRDLFPSQNVGAVINASYESLRKGQDFTGPLEASQLFQPVAISMLKVGQETGDLATAAQHVATMSEDRFEVAVQRLFTVLEPTIILLVSLFVAGIIVSIIGAVISVNDLVI